MKSSCPGGLCARLSDVDGGNWRKGWRRTAAADARWVLRTGAGLDDARRCVDRVCLSGPPCLQSLFTGVQSGIAVRPDSTAAPTFANKRLRLGRRTMQAQPRAQPLLMLGTASRCVALRRLDSLAPHANGVSASEGAGPQECGSAGRPRSKVADLMAATLPPRQAPASSIPVELHKAHCRPVRPRPSSAGGATWLAGRLGTSRLELTCQWYPTDSSTPRQWRGARTHIGVHVPSCRTSSKFRAAVALLPRQSPAEPNPPCTHGTYMASWSAAIGLPPSNLHPLMIRFIIATAVPVSCSCHLGTRSCWARRVAATHLGSSPPAPSIEAIRFDPRSLADTKAMAIASGFCALRDHTPELPDPPFPRAFP